MKRFWIILLAVAVALVIALPAGAKKPDKPDKPPPEPRGGYTCLDFYDEVNQPGDWQYLEYPGPEGEPFEFTLGGGKGRSACIDVSAPVGGVWTVTVIESRGRGLAMTVRDSIAPGDVCLNESYEGAAGDVYYLKELPASHVNACGTEWGELIDGELVMKEQTDIPNPLAFIVRVSGSPTSETTIEVDLP